ncbi:hypothetical protein O181_006957 [Austropuccinia psidii MF-1]|uniref:Integrase catalytic domain-containing protein n=1 Tax=Austropuccinia psidii MF-1 TaxID=1389203 RepID=A0A9Q3BL04_9BASI|nr:hypothetical protein [Austropuccinia psidii MF-1]
MTKMPFPGHFPKASSKGEYLHLDLCGPITPPSESGAKYFLRVVDSFSRYVWVFFLQSKSEAKDKVKNLILQIQKNPESMVSNIVSDNGTEFKNFDLLSFFQKEGISHLVTSPYTPQQNPLAERGNRTTVNKARCLLKDSGLPLSYWAEAVNTAVYLENLTPNSAISFEKPFKRWYNKEPSLNHLHPFGCRAVFYNNYINGKFSDRGVKGTFLGYGEGHCSFRILDMEKGNVVISHHVKFDNNLFPYKENPPSNQDSLGLFFYDKPDSPSEQPSLLSSDQPAESSTDLLTVSPIETELTPHTSSSVPPAKLPKHKGYTWIPDTSSPIQNEIIGDIDSRNILNSPRRHAHSINSVSCLYPDPKTYHQAIHCPEKDFWIDAIKSELNNMLTHQVWTPSNHPSHLKPLTTTWVFKKKTDEDGNLTKFKARLCVRGFNQKEGVDYDEIFAPTGRLASL